MNPSISDKLKERLVHHLNVSEGDSISASTPLSKKLEDRIMTHLKKDEKEESEY